MDAMARVAKPNSPRHLNSLAKISLTGLSRSFAGKEAKSDLGAGIFEQVKDIVNTKPAAAGSFADLQAQLKKSQLADDTQFL